GRGDPEGHSRSAADEKIRADRGGRGARRLPVLGCGGQHHRRGAFNRWRLGGAMKDGGGGAPGGERKKINLALQGGGAHGAFTWGVLDRLLEDGRLEIEAISGTSAGAMNAVAMADGFVRGGNEGARERLAAFWKAVAESARFSPIRRAPLDVLMGNWTLDTSLGYMFL